MSFLRNFVEPERPQITRRNSKGNVKDSSENVADNGDKKKKKSSSKGNAYLFYVPIYLQKWSLKNPIKIFLKPKCGAQHQQQECQSNLLHL